MMRQPTTTITPSDTYTLPFPIYPLDMKRGLKRHLNLNDIFFIKNFFISPPPSPPPPLPFFIAF